MNFFPNEKDNNSPNQIIQKNLYNEQIKIQNMLKNIFLVGNDEKYGLGFFCNILLKNLRILPVLIVNNNIIDKEDIFQNKNIIISLSNEETKYILIIDKSRKIFINNYNIQIIEIKSNDNINKNYFIEIDDFIYKTNIQYLLINKLIYQINLNNKEYLLGTIKNVINDDYYYIKYINIIKDKSPSCFIINLENNKIIGIHLDYDENLNLGVGMNFKSIIEGIF